MPEPRSGAEQGPESPSDRPDRLPLTGAQHGLWIGQQLDPANPAYNTAEYVEIRGPLDVDAFGVALRRTVAECEAVNVRFGVDGEQPYQVLGAPADWTLHLLDLTASDDPAAAADTWMAADLLRTVDLGQGPIFAHALLRTGEDLYRWYHRVHHIGLDGYGLALFARRVAGVYNALMSGRDWGTSPFGALAEAVAAEESYRLGPRREADRAYWVSRFDDRPDPATLSDRPGFGAASAIRVVRDLGPEVVQRLRSVAKESSTTWPDVLIAAVAAYLHHLTATPEVVLALPVMNRLGTAAVRVPCTVLNVVPLRIPVSSEATLAELATRVAAQVRADRRHHHYRYEDLQRDLRLLGGRRRLFGPAVNIMPFDYGLDFAGSPAVVHNVSAGPVEDLSIAVYDRADGSDLRIILGANPDRYQLPEVRAHLEGLLQTLAEATGNPHRPASSACALTPPAVLDGGPHTVAPRPLPEVIAEHARARPGAVAVEHDGVEVSYQELVRRAGALSARLRDRGVRPGDLVALLLPHGIEAVVAILAVLSSGAGYVPLDVKARRERWDHMLGVTGPVALITDSSGAQALPDPAMPTIVTGPERDDDPDRHGEASGPTDPAGPAGPGATAYVLFTSGSTGDPKAVAISHRALSVYAAGAGEVYRLDPQDRAAHFLPLHFDGHVEEVLVTLYAGATVVVRSQEMTQSVGRMVAGWERLRLSVLNLPTSYWHEVVHGLAGGSLTMPGCVRTAIIGGEAALAERARQWFSAVGDRVRLINTYGPTEATVVAVAAELTPDCVDGSGVPIGHPFPGMRAVVVDDHGRLAPAGGTGELYLVGEALATGYLGRPDLDAARFAPLAQLPDRPRAYRTGDLVRRHADGRLHFVGRVDDEFKVSGHRVDPGEIEAVLLGIPGVAQAAVVGQISAAGSRHLSAHLVADGAEPAPAPAPAQVRAYVRERLPAALVPTVVEFVTALPRTTSGKVDRAALRRRAAAPTDPGTGAAAAAQDGSGGDDPADGLQRTVMRVWQEVLGIDPPGPDDDFFDLGGQSLQTIQVANRLSAELGRDVTVATVFRYPTVAELAAGLDLELGLADTANRSVTSMLADAELPDTIRPPGTVHAGPAGGPGAVHAGPAGGPGTVLLTGATGFLGAHLLGELLGRTDDRVICLVRADDEEAARQRLERSLLAQGLPTAGLSERVEALPSDLARPDLGLDPDTFARVAASCDVVYHNAAVISVMRGYTSLRGANVVGTRELLRLACVRGVPVHYISTLNVAPPSTVRAEVPERFLPAHPGLRDGYQQSKWAAERLVEQAGQRGLPVSVYRLARIVGSPDTGFVNPEDLLWRVLRVGIPIGAIPLLYRADAWTPVDFVARAVVHLARTAAPAVYNLVPYPELPLADLCAWINDYGYGVTLEPLARWRSMLPDAAADITTMAFFDLWSGGDGEEDLEIGKLIRDNMVAGLAGSGIECPQPSAGLMARYLDYCVREGLLPAPGGAR